MVTPTGSEGREIRALRAKSRISDFVLASMHRRPLDGASGEYAEARSMPDNHMPTELLLGEHVPRTGDPRDNAGAGIGNRDEHAADGALRVCPH